MMLHFQFTNGSNPFIFRGTERNCRKTLKQWKKHWNIKEIASGGNVYFYELTEKEYDSMEAINKRYEEEQKYNNFFCGVEE